MNEGAVEEREDGWRDASEEGGRRRGGAESGRWGGAELGRRTEEVAEGVMDEVPWTGGGGRRCDWTFCWKVRLERDGRGGSDMEVEEGPGDERLVCKEREIVEWEEVSCG